MLGQLVYQNGVVVTSTGGMDHFSSIDNIDSGKYFDKKLTLLCEVDQIVL